MHLLPAVDVGLGKCDFHFLRTKSLQLNIKDVHQKVIYLGPCKLIKYEVEFTLEKV